MELPRRVIVTFTTTPEVNEYLDSRARDTGKSRSLVCHETMKEAIQPDWPEAA